MSVVPATRLGKVQYYESHISPWQINALAIGLTEAEVSALEAKTQAARAAFNAQVAAMQAAKVATEAYHNAVASMATSGAGLMDKIRGQAKKTLNPDVYTLAQIPAPPAPTPVGNPGTPEAFKAKLLPNGSLELTWKCKNPKRSINTLYHVYHKNAAGQWIFIGGCGERKFLDATVPSGVETVYYQVQAARSTAIGTAAQFIVNFGTGADGAMTTTVTNVTPAPKLAA